MNRVPKIFLESSQICKASQIEKEWIVIVGFFCEKKLEFFIQSPKKPVVDC
jgi:hypothetical protein